LFGLERIFGDIETFDHNPAGIGLKQADDQLDCCRFAGAVQAEKAKDFTGLDGKSQAVNGFDLAAVVAL